MDRPLTIRLTAAELHELSQMADAAGCSKAELIRRHWRQRAGASLSEIAEMLAGVAALIVQVDERLIALESHSAETREPVADGAVLSRIETLEANTERTLSALVRAVEKLYQAHAAPMSSVRVPDTSSAPSSPPPSYISWQAQLPKIDSETPQERAARLHPQYVAKFGEPS